MSNSKPPSPSEAAVALVHEFFARVWGPAHDLAAIDDLMTPDYHITSGGRLIEGRDAFKEWVRGFQHVLQDARTTSTDAFANSAGDHVVSRWICTGRNNGIFNLPPDGRPVAFTGIAIWRIRDGRFAECWAERAGLEAYRALAGTGGTAP
jgi:predicted ester cyclase